MYKKFILLVCLLLLNCSKDETWKQDLIGTAQIGGSAEGYANCIDTYYGAW